MKFLFFVFSFLVATQPLPAAVLTETARNALLAMNKRSPYDAITEKAKISRVYPVEMLPKEVKKFRIELPNHRYKVGYHDYLKADWESRGFSEKHLMAEHKAINPRFIRNDNSDVYWAATTSKHGMLIIAEKTTPPDRPRKIFAAMTSGTITDFRESVKYQAKEFLPNLFKKPENKKRLPLFVDMNPQEYTQVLTDLILYWHLKDSPVINLTRDYNLLPEDALRSMLFFQKRQELLYARHALPYYDLVNQNSTSGIFAVIRHAYARQHQESLPTMPFKRLSLHRLGLNRDPYRSVPAEILAEVDPKAEEYATRFIDEMKSHALQHVER